MEFDLKSRREKLLDYLEDNECLLFYPRDLMEKGDSDYFHSIDSMFRYYFSNQEIKMLGLTGKKDGKIVEKLGVVMRSEIEEYFMGEVDLDKISKDSQINNVVEIDQLKEELNEFEKISCVYDYKNNYFNEFRKIINELEEKYGLEIGNRFDEIKELRVVKSKDEIDCIKIANHYAKESFEYVLSKVKESQNEYDLFAHLSYKIFSLHSKHAFYPIIAGGVRATTLHYPHHNQDLNENDLILSDFGCEYNGYQSDITRVFPKSGKFTKRQKEVYEAVLRVQEYAISQLKAGVLLNEYEKLVRIKMGEELIGLGLLTKDEIDNDFNCIRKYYPHRTSHFLGLDTHDVGSYDQEIKEGLVLTVEPGIYINDEEIGIRIEDNVVIRENGCDNLSIGIIKSVDEIEEFMNKN